VPPHTALTRLGVATSTSLVIVRSWTFTLPAVEGMTVPGFDTAVFPFTTDIPFLQAWGEPLLFGPGSIHLAHTADEFVSITELKTVVAAPVPLLVIEPVMFTAPVWMVMEPPDPVLLIMRFCVAPEPMIPPL